MKSCVVVINPNSGRGTKKNEGKIINKLKEYDYIGKIYYTKYPNHAEEIVLNVDADLLISIGGDGTFYEVMNGNFKKNKPIILSHIPMGTTNDIGHMYGLGGDIIKNLDAILSGVVKKIDICSINNRYFVYVASFGKFMEIPYETPQKLKKRLGHAAYLINGSKDLFKKTKKYNITYEIDGVKHNGEYTFIIISNANRIAGINNFYRDMKLDDQKFEVLLCTANNKTKLVNSFIEYYLGMKPKNMISFKANDLKIKLSEIPEKNWCVDGEKLEENTSYYHINANNKMDFLVPKNKTKKLFLNNDV